MNASLDKIRNGIERLNDFNSTKEEGQGTTRVLFTKVELEARAFIKNLMTENGLQVEEDAIGNIFGILQGDEPKLPCVWSGSHIDTVYNAGMFDGMAGVIAAIEALRLIKESGKNLKRTLKAVVFTSEEPTRFGLSCLGSRTMAGHLKRKDLSGLKDKQGKSLEQILMELNYDLESFHEIEKSSEEVYASIELHIEQGAVLEKKGLPIGVVESICAPTNITVRVIGVQEHAGSTPMAIRHDALVASSELVIWLESLIKSFGGKHTVGTIGHMEVFPNAENVIPGEVRFTIDIRDSIMENKEVILKKIIGLFHEIEKNRGVEIEYSIRNHDRPRHCSENVNQIIRSVCDNEGIPYHSMVSGAYHDSIFVSEFAPTAMIFVPSRDGISHHHLEWTDYEDIKKGTDILAKSLLRLSNQ